MHIIPLAAEEIEKKILNIPDHWGEVAEDTFDPESIHAQSGKAVAQAIENTIQFTTQELNTDQQTQARANIGAASSDALNNLNSQLSSELETLNTNVSNELFDIKGQLADLLYKPISILSFTQNLGIREIGEAVSDIELSWSFNKTPILLTLDDEPLDVETSVKVVNDVIVTHDNNKTWVLTGTDERGATDTKSLSILFYNGIYHGIGTEAAEFTSNFVTNLDKELKSSRSGHFTVNPSEQYIYYAFPVRLGTATFSVGGFQGGFEPPVTVQVTNSYGYTEDYYVYRSTNLITGLITVDVT